MRTYLVSKTRQNKPKITLYEDGRPLLARPVKTVQSGNRIGRAWAESLDES